MGEGPVNYQTPCQDPDGLGMDSWFIGKDGKQYSDDELLTEEQIEEVKAEFDAGALQGSVDERIDELETEAKRQALILRRRARDACYECYFRTDCLNTVLGDPNIKHGTWGGYYEEQIREVRAAKRKRDKRNGPQE